MKQLITLIMLAGLAIAIQAQDINTQLGANGKFYIKDNSGVTNFEFTHDVVNFPELKIGANIQSVGADAFQFRIQNSSGIGPAMSLENIGTGTPSIYFHKSNGGGAVSGENLGYITFLGSNGTSFHEYARIAAGIDEYSTTGGNLTFKTGTLGGTFVRMVIDPSGNVGINTTAPNSTLDVNGKVNVSGSLSMAINNVGNSDHTATDSDYTIVFENNTEVTCSLPDAATCEGRIYIIKKKSVVAGNVVIDGDGTQTIDGALTLTLDAAYEYAVIQSTGSVWLVIGGNY